MIAAVSTSILGENTPPPAAASTGKQKRGGVSAAVGPQWFACPDLSDEQRKAMAKARVTDTYLEIVSQLNRRRFKGRTSLDREMAEGGCLQHLGVKGLARATGRDPKTTARHLKWLVSAGLVTVTNPNVTITREPATGRISKNPNGRRDPCVIVLTVNAEQLRPRAVRGNDAPQPTVTTTNDRGNCAPQSSAASVRDRGNCAPVFPKEKRNLEGRRPSSGESGRPTAKWGQEEPREPRAFTGDAAEAFRRTKERLEREARERYTEPAPLRVTYLPHQQPETTETPAESMEQLKAKAIAALAAMDDQHNHSGSYQRLTTDGQPAGRVA